MKAPLFLENKVKRLLRTSGIQYDFISVGKDAYNQPTESSEVLSVKGVYHEQNSFITVSSSEAASVQRKKSPMILTLFTDSVRKLKQGDKVYINERLYKVSGVLDIQNYGVVADISLEMEV